MSDHNDSTPIVNRLTFWFFMSLLIGTFSAIVAYWFGELTLRNLLLSTLMIVFVVSGGVFTLLLAQHFTDIHLAEGSLEFKGPATLSEEELRAEQELRRSKGFMGLFTVSRETVVDGQPVQVSQRRKHFE